MFLDNLGTCLSDRYSRTGATENLEKAIRVAQQAVDITPFARPRKPTHGLGWVFVSRPVGTISIAHSPLSSYHP
ncbi:unnamed protein product [Penicillium camemberti]|uniref:Str. FM013 n=1 Tax=Penicillium camemberti (strain FM 013) TaxID=1429867 RepID=A0A0G4P3F1_PENC3|nr:unnamed protein product [Penicillium camemberti]